MHLALNEFPLADLLDLWEHLTNGEKPYQPSISCVVCAVNIESQQAQPIGAFPQDRPSANGA